MRELLPTRREFSMEKRDDILLETSFGHIPLVVHRSVHFLNKTSHAFPYPFHLLVPGFGCPIFLGKDRHMKTYFDRSIAEMIDYYGEHPYVIATFSWPGQTRGQTDLDHGKFDYYDINYHPLVFAEVLEQLHSHLSSHGHCVEVIFEGQSMGARALAGLAARNIGPTLSDYAKSLGLPNRHVHLGLHQAAFGIHERLMREANTVARLPKNIRKVPFFDPIATKVLRQNTLALFAEGAITKSTYFEEIMERDILDPATTILHLQGLTREFPTEKVMKSILEKNYGTVWVSQADNDSLVNSSHLVLCNELMQNNLAAVYEVLQNANHTPQWS